MINFMVDSYFSHLMFQLETKEARGDVLQKRLNDPVDVAPFKYFDNFFSVMTVSFYVECIVALSFIFYVLFSFQGPYKIFASSNSVICSRY